MLLLIRFYMPFFYPPTLHSFLYLCTFCICLMRMNCSIFNRLHLPIFVLLIGLCRAITYGQTSSELPQSIQFQFSRQNNFTYTTNLDVYKQDIRIGKYHTDIRLHHDNIVNTLLNQPFVQVYVRGQIWQYYDVSKKLSVASFAEIDQFWHNRNQKYSLYGGVNYQPIEGLQLTPLVGYSWDYLTPILNQGFSPALRFQYQYAFKNGWEMQTKAFLRTKFITPRKQHNYTLQTAWNKTLNSNAMIAFAGILGSNETDNFRQNSIERILSDTLSPSMQAIYRFNKHWQLTSENQYQFTRRRFLYQNYRTSTAEFNNLGFTQNDVRLSQLLSMQYDKMEGQVRYTYEYANRQYFVSNNLGLTDNAFVQLTQKEKQKDFIRNISVWEAEWKWKMSRKHLLKWTGNNRYVMYDTPSELNYDDHDELSYGTGLEWNADWRRTFYTRYGLIGSVRKYVFLFRQKSQDNYTQYNLRSEFAFRWQIMPKLTLSGEQFVYVNYNVKDFTDANFTNRSTRNLESRLQVTYQPTPKWACQFHFYIKEAHLSYLDWDAFAETTLDTTETATFEQRNGYRIVNQQNGHLLWLDFGYKHFFLNRYQNTAMFDLQNVLKPINLHIRNIQTGFLTGARWSYQGKYSVEGMLWWQIQNIDNRYHLLPAFSTLSASYREEDLQRVQRAFRPFVTLTLNMRL